VVVGGLDTTGPSLCGGDRPRRHTRHRHVWAPLVNCPGNRRRRCRRPRVRDRPLPVGALSGSPPSHSSHLLAVERLCPFPQLPARGRVPIRNLRLQPVWTVPCGGPVRRTPMARLVAGGFSYQRSDDPARVTVSILARELDISPRAVGSMTHIDTSNRNYGIHVDCLRISDDNTRISFSGQVDMTTNPTFKDRWVHAIWENVGGQWYLMGNWTDGPASPGCDGPPPPSPRFTAELGSLSILSV
jgi:hypothetical protein